jgi:hypothetical protein
MPKGGRRLGAGRPALPVSLHLARGTYRPSRHATALSTQGEPEAHWQPEPGEFQALGAAGRALIEKLLMNFDVSLADGLTALEAAKAADRIEVWAAREATSGTPAAAAAAERLRLAWAKHLAGLLHTLRAAE